MNSCNIVFDMLLCAGTSSPHPVPVEVKLEVMVNKDSENAPQSNDEDR